VIKQLLQHLTVIKK